MVQNSPSAKVTRFKEFVRNHPGLIHEVRGQKRSWQDVYEEWDIFGEDPELWDSYLPGAQSKKPKDTKNAKENGGNTAGKQAASGKKSQLSLANLFALLEKVDFDQLQNNLSQFSGALENAQKIMGQMQKKNSSSGNSGPPGMQGGPSGMQGGPQGPPGPPGYGPYPPQYNNNNSSNNNQHHPPFPY